MRATSRKPPSGGFYGIAGALLSVMAWAQITSAKLEVQTADEAVHLVSGYSILRQGRFSLNAENPPVSKVLSALPLLWLNPDLPVLKENDWQDENTVAISVPFLYRNRIPADRILFWGRLPTILLTLAFGAALALWTRYRFGEMAALIALCLFCFDPNFIAHGRYVTSDVAGACFYFLAVVTWREYLVHPRILYFVMASLLTAIGICAKFNLFLLLPLLLGFAVWYWPVWRALKHFAVYLIVVAITIWAVYGFETSTIAADEPVARFLRLTSEELRASQVLPRPVIMFLDPAARTGQAIHWMAENIPIPAYSFIKGLYRLFNHSYWGHRAYLLGEVSHSGWWYYFPVAFLVKTATGTLLLLIITATALRGCRPAILLIPPLLYFAVSMAGSINIGVRHILPVYPFLFVWIGAVAAKFRGRHAVVAALALMLIVAESALIYPHYLAFFNTPSGGSDNGPKYLVDSNIDWGQDVLKLKRYMEENRLSSIPFHYFGAADLGYYQVPFESLQQAISAAKRGPAAISATALQMEEQFVFLRKCDPIARVGYSIYVFDLGSRSCAAKP